MDANLGDYIKQFVKEMARVNKSQIRLEIWGGLGVDRNSGTIFTCPTSGTTNKIYAVKKTALDQWRKGNYKSSYDELVNTARIIGITNETAFGLRNTSYFNESLVSTNPTSPSFRPVPPYISRPTAINANKGLLNELTFFLKEVHLCTINPLTRMALKDGYVNPSLHDVVAVVKDQSTLSIDTNNVDIILKNNIDRRNVDYVPKGGGRASGRYNPNNLYFKVNRNSSNNRGPFISARINSAKSMLNNIDQSDNCYIKDRDEPLEGDIWYNGVRSSISNGIYEVWVDDMGGGPMVRASRQSVYEAAARYKKNISPTSERYAGYRTSPMANKVASNAITPVKVYVENWWEDPQLYAGIIAVLFALMQTLDEKQDSFEFSKKFIDAGAFDYDKMYKPMQGMDA